MFEDINIDRFYAPPHFKTRPRLCVVRWKLFCQIFRIAKSTNETVPDKRVLWFALARTVFETCLFARTPSLKQTSSNGIDSHPAQWRSCDTKQQRNRMLFDRRRIVPSMKVKLAQLVATTSLIQTAATTWKNAVVGHRSELIVVRFTFCCTVSWAVTSVEPELALSK